MAGLKRAGRECCGLSTAELSETNVKTLASEAAEAMPRSEILPLTLEGVDDAAHPEDERMIQGLTVGATERS